MAANRLRKNERCPLHGSRFCCGREQKPKTIRHVQVQGAVTLIPDETLPKSYRELCSKPELRRRKDIKIREQKGICALCQQPMDHYAGVELDHIRPKGLNGSTRDDSMENLQAAHVAGNRAKASMSLEAYFEKYSLPERIRLCEGR